MKRIESIEDDMQGVVRYELANGQMASFDARAVREYGVAALMRAYGLEKSIPTERLPVMHHGRYVGTMAPDFDPANVRSTSLWYDPRPGDFRREGSAWIAGRTLGPGDLDMVKGFERSSS